MARSLTAGALAASQAQTAYIGYLVKMVFDGGTLRLWDGYADLTWDSQTWLGNGWFTSFSPVNESIDSEASSLTVELSGIPSTVASLILNNGNKVATCEFYLAFFDSSWSIISDPYMLFSGKLDTAEINDDGEEPIFELVFHPKFSDLEENEFRYTKETQKIFDATDLGFDYVPSLQEWKGTWGRVAKRRVTPSKQNKRRQARRRKKRRNA